MLGEERRKSCGKCQFLSKLEKALERAVRQNQGASGEVAELPLRPRAHALGPAGPGEVVTAREVESMLLHVVWLRLSVNDSDIVFHF